MMELDLVENGGEMVFKGFLSDEQELRNDFIAVTLGDERE